MSEGKTIFRSRPARDFTTYPNDLVRDKTLSFKARGILEMILSHREDWTVTKGWIEKQTPLEGREAVRSGLAELERAGYAKFGKERGDDGTFCNQGWTFYDLPLPENERSSATKGIWGQLPPRYGLPSPGLPESGQPAPGNPYPSEDNGTETVSSEGTATETPAKAGDGEAKMEVTGADHANLIEWWMVIYQEATQTKYPFGPRDAKAVKQLLKHFQSLPATREFIAEVQRRQKDGYPFANTTTLYDIANGLARLLAALQAPPQGRRGEAPKGVPVLAEDLPRIE